MATKTAVAARACVICGMTPVEVAAVNEDKEAWPACWLAIGICSPCAELVDSDALEREPEGDE